MITAWLQRYLATGLAAIALAALTWGGIEHLWRAGAQRDLAEAREGFAEARTLALRATAIEEARQRAEEARRHQAIQKAIDHATQENERQRADLAIADVVAGRLQQRVAALVAAAREASRDTPAAQGSAATANPVVVLADVFGRCVARVRDLAALADARGGAGSTCERIGDEVIGGP